MIRHNVMWKIKDEYRDRIEEIRAGAKKGLEGLNGQLRGLRSLTVYTQGLDTAAADMMLQAVFDTEEDFRAYRTHPAHVEVANTFVRPFVQTRLSFDYME